MDLVQFGLVFLHSVWVPLIHYCFSLVLLVWPRDLYYGLIGLGFDLMLISVSAELWVGFDLGYLHVGWLVLPLLLWIWFDSVWFFCIRFGFHCFITVSSCHFALMLFFVCFAVSHAPILTSPHAVVLCLLSYILYIYPFFVCFPFILLNAFVPLVCFAAISCLLLFFSFHVCLECL